MALPKTPGGRASRLPADLASLIQGVFQGAARRRRACGGAWGQRSLVETGRMRAPGSWQRAS